MKRVSGNFFCLVWSPVINVAVTFSLVTQQGNKLGFK